MKKIWITLTILLVSSAVTLAQKTSGPVMKFDKEVYEFGTVKAGTKVQHDFVFTNSGNEPLIISNAQGSCGCTVPDYPKQPIKKGEKAAIKVSFDSTGRTGVQEKTVTITSNSSDTPTKVIYIRGTVEAAPLNVTPESKPVEKPQQ